MYKPDTPVLLSSAIYYWHLRRYRECVALVKELGLEVRHIVLPTFAYEHKVFVGPFSRKFKGAQVRPPPVQPGIQRAHLEIHPRLQAAAGALLGGRAVGAQNSHS